MVDKRGDVVTTSFTTVDMHDIARSSRTYGAESVFISHSSPSIRKLAHSLVSHWNEGYGSTYNPDRKEALAHVHVVESLDEAIHKVECQSGKLPKLIATSAKSGAKRCTFASMRELIKSTDEHYVLMLGTGWGMTDELLHRSDFFLEPIDGPTDYNHLSVRSACAIMLDRLLAPS